MSFFEVRLSQEQPFTVSGRGIAGVASAWGAQPPLLVRIEPPREERQWQLGWGFLGQAGSLVPL